MENDISLTLTKKEINILLFVIPHQIETYEQRPQYPKLEFLKRKKLIEDGVSIISFLKRKLQLDLPYYDIPFSESQIGVMFAYLIGIYKNMLDGNIRIPGRDNDEEITPKEVESLYFKLEKAFERV